MKKIFILFLSALFLVCGCDNSNIIPKTEFKIEEEASIDDIDIVLKNAKRDETSLEITFEITNRRDNAITISPEKNFVIYDNQVQLTNNFQNQNNIIKKDQTIMYTLNYGISKRELYEIYFYSGVVENNIKFNLTSLDFN